MNSMTVRHSAEANPNISVPDPHQDVYSKTMLGFWIYLMTDCLLFGSLFATYGVLHTNTFGGPTSKELFHLSSAFIEIVILLTSSMLCGFGVLSAVQNEKNKVIGWLSLTFLLGAFFLVMELHEFTALIHEGNNWTRSAFLSSFFALVGTHGLHITVGLWWLLVMLAQVYWQGITISTFRRLVVFSLFWHFLDVVWIFIFTFVYLMGVL